MSSMACKEEVVEEPNTIMLDAYSLYILEPGPFVSAGPEYPENKLFLILKSGEVEISFGKAPGAQISEDAVELYTTNFALNNIRNENWLPGCNKWQLDAAPVTIGEIWYYYTTLLVRRDAARTEAMPNIHKTIHEHEIDRFTNDTDMIVRVYYTLHENDIYMMTLSGLPEDVVVKEKEVRALLASVRFDATTAMRELQGPEAREE